jgi:hypothetical protein
VYGKLTVLEQLIYDVPGEESARAGHHNATVARALAVRRAGRQQAHQEA